VPVKVSLVPMKVPLWKSPKRRERYRVITSSFCLKFWLDKKKATNLKTRPVEESTSAREKKEKESKDKKEREEG
jgi:hypothetical protein